ncbi:hypothetical protein K438DRAFT_1778493 [Mycena galopus ATCC 62051]|nr:hypothetical protein K438DRAFT_1778493 [Mycena galopus ATCC 62051]
MRMFHNTEFPGGLQHQVAILPYLEGARWADLEDLPLVDDGPVKTAPREASPGIAGSRWARQGSLSTNFDFADLAHSTDAAEVGTEKCLLTGPQTIRRYAAVRGLADGARTVHGDGRLAMVMVPADCRAMRAGDRRWPRIGVQCGQVKRGSAARGRGKQAPGGGADECPPSPGEGWCTLRAKKFPWSRVSNAANFRGAAPGRVGTPPFSAKRCFRKTARGAEFFREAGRGGYIREAGYPTIFRATGWGGNCRRRGPTLPNLISAADRASLNTSDHSIPLSVIALPPVASRPAPLLRHRHQTHDRVSPSRNA